MILSVRDVATLTSRHTHPEEGIKCSVLHEFGDDEDGAASRQHALEPDHVRMLKLTHDGGLGEEVPPLALRVAGFQRLDRHHHLPAAGLLEPPAAHLTEFTWGETRGWWQGEGRGWGGEGDGGEGLSERRKEEEGWGERGSRRKCKERELYWSVSGVKELI